MSIHYSRLKNLELEVVEATRGSDYSKEKSKNDLIYSKSDEPSSLTSYIKSAQQLEKVDNLNDTFDNNK